MRRDNFTIEIVTDTASDDGPRPLIDVVYDGPVEEVDERLTDATGSPLDASDVDVAFRRHPPDADSEATGVLSLTNRYTGEYFFEANVDAAAVEAVVRDAQATDGDAQSYGLRICAADGEPLTFEKELLVVYDQHGELRRNESLIPNGVEL